MNLKDKNVPLRGSAKKKSTPAGDGRRRGFTLIETLVAMMVFSIAVVVILQLFSGGLRAARLSESTTLAIFYARQKMETLLLTPEPETGESSGEFENGYVWKAVVETVSNDKDEGFESVDLPVETYQISVEIAWPEGGGMKHFELQTLRLVAADSNDNG